MSKSNSRNIFDFLFEAEDVKEMDKKKKDLDEAELSLELEDEEVEALAGAEDAEAVDAALEDILGDLEVEMADEPAGEAEDAGEDGGEEAADEPAGEEDGGLDLGEMDYKKELDEKDHVDEMDEVYEIDENALRRELQRLTEEAADEADQFGGGDIPHGDVFVDVDEEDLINALADELGSAPSVAAESRTRRRTRTSKALVEAKRQIKLQNSTIAGLKKQLVEMNLFNAKLLYANKLMQNKNLSLPQQKSIVEALDSAKTLREAKLLFKSLSTSLTRKKANKLNEGALRNASASRAVKSGQPQNDASPEGARWAVLAGI